jgi:hypothetical protein
LFEDIWLFGLSSGSSAVSGKLRGVWDLDPMLPVGDGDVNWLIGDWDIGGMEIPREDWELIEILSKLS